MCERCESADTTDRSVRPLNRLDVAQVVMVSVYNIMVEVLRAMGNVVNLVAHQRYAKAQQELLVQQFVHELETLEVDNG